MPPLKRSQDRLAKFLSPWLGLPAKGKSDAEPNYDEMSTIDAVLERARQMLRPTIEEQNSKIGLTGELTGEMQSIPKADLVWKRESILRGDPESQAYLDSSTDDNIRRTAPDWYRDYQRRLLEKIDRELSIRFGKELLRRPLPIDQEDQ